MSDIYISFASAIIKQQESIVGPLAWGEAKKVPGLVVEDHKIAIKGNGKIILEKLVNQYATLFGRASVEACRDAVHRLISDVNKNDIPSLLL